MKAIYLKKSLAILLALLLFCTSVSGGVAFAEGEETIITATEEAVDYDAIRGNIVGREADRGGTPIRGALFGLFRPGVEEYTAETATATAEADEDGIFTFRDVPYGEWIIRQLRSAEGYAANTISYPVSIVEDKSVVGVNVESHLVSGAVNTVAVDKGDVNHRLTGAVFEVWYDKDGDGAVTEGADILAGQLTETEDGLYILDGLPCGAYLLRETKAPLGFLLDEGVYPFLIEVDGQRVTIENEECACFVHTSMFTENEPRESAQPTDAPADATPDPSANSNTPKTGDEARPWRLVVLLTVSGLGIAGIVLFFLRRRVYEDE